MRILINKIDNMYIQQGDVCVFASYAIIVNYFSNGTKSVSDIIKSVAKSFNISTNNIKCRENKIHHLYFRNAKKACKRGFDFVTQLHNSNAFDTRRYCNIESTKICWTAKRPLSRKIIGQLLKRLKKGSLAMILRDNMNHAVTIFYNKEKSSFCIRDTANTGIKTIKPDEIGKVYEFIIFCHRKSKLTWQKKGR